MYARISGLTKQFLSDNLFRNSIYLMATTVVMGAFGFFFWGICTRLFTPDEIGLGTTLISAMGLISTISLLGFNTTFVRFLPTSKNPDEEINTGSILVMSAAAIAAALYIVLIPILSPSLELLHENIWFSLGFVVMVALASINSLTDSIFVAYRSAHFALITDGFISSGTKLVLPLAFAGLGAYGVFAASGFAATLGMLGSVLILIFKFKYRPQASISIPFLKKVFHYSFTNYLASLINMAPTFVLPLIIINHLGAAAAGYYYLAFMIINLLYSVASSVSQSLFAEGSYADAELRALIKRSTILLLGLMTPAIAVLVFFGPLVLQFFGKSYSAGGAGVIVILALAAPAVAAYSLASVLLRIRHQAYSLVASNIIYAVAIVALTLLWIDQGLEWASIAWAAGNALAALFAFASIYLHRAKPTPVITLQ